MHFIRQYDRNPVSFAIFAKIAKVWDQKKFLIKQSLLKFMTHSFIENDDFFWNSVESSEFVNSVRPTYWFLQLDCTERMHAVVVLD